MGWSGGTDVFDAMAEVILYGKVSLSILEQELLLGTLLEALGDADWDTESDSAYYGHPIVRKILKAQNPEMEFDDEDEDTSGKTD